MITSEAMIYPVLFAAVSVTVASFLLFFKNPSLIVKMYMRFAILRSGMKILKVNLGDINIVYGKKGRKTKGRSSILLLHGFSADKFMWAPLVKNLPQDLHVIAVDLPGHGESDQPPDDEDISLTGQLHRIKQFAEAVGLTEEPFHIIGLSMGGALAGLYSAKYPDHIDRVTMMCPAMRTPISSDIAVKIKQIVESDDEEVIKEQCPLLPKTPEEMQCMLDFAQFHKAIFMPKKILEGAVEMRKPYNAYYIRLFKALASVDNSGLLEKTASRITVPSQIIWGQEDQVIHVSGADVLKKKLPNCKSVDIIPRCGHAINLDRPGSKTKYILKFRGEITSQNKS